MEVADTAMAPGAAESVREMVRAEVQRAWAQAREEGAIPDL